MKTTLRFHEYDDKPDAPLGDLANMFRKDDMLVYKKKFYKVEYARFDLDKNEAIYFLCQADDADRECPNSRSE